MLTDHKFDILVIYLSMFFSKLCGFVGIIVFVLFTNYTKCSPVFFFCVYSWLYF